jgi:HPt (histidine-containing phosphotransfer) domain-containing protein
MDDYLSKPIDRIRLEVCLERLLSTTGSTGLMHAAREDSGVEGAPQPSAVQPHPPVDWDGLLESIDGDNEFARDLADAFIGTGDRELAAIAAALDAGDTAALRESAHALKGASANLRAAAATSAAAQLEAAARLGKSAQIPGLAENLTSEVRRMTAYLRAKVG